MDVSKDTIDACFSQQEVDVPFRILSSHTFAATATGFRKLQEWICRHRHAPAPLHLMMEATGVYYEEVAYFLHDKGHRLSVLLPNKTHFFGKSLDHKSKTDKIDARKLAQMSLERNLPKWEPPSDTMLTIKRLCRERADFLHDQIVTSNRLHAKNHSHAPEKSSLKRSKEMVKFFNKQIKETEAAIRTAIEADPLIKEKLDNVCSLTGIGLVTAATVVSEANGFTLFKNKAQIVSYAGFDVVENTSGTSIHSPTKISKRGNARIRKALYFPAIVAVQHNPAMREMFDRVFNRTKIKMKAYVSVQRKLLVLIYTLYKNNQKFDPNYVSVKNTEALAEKR